jgi:hypothetical protein
MTEMVSVHVGRRVWASIGTVVLSRIGVVGANPIRTGSGG